MPYITVKQYADYKGITVQYVYSNIKKGILNSIKQFKDGRNQTFVEITEQEFKEIENSLNDSLTTKTTDFKPKEREFTEYLIKENERKDKIIEELNQQIKELNIKIADYTLRFAELADKAITTTGQAQVLQAVDKQVLPGETIEQPTEEEKKPGFFSRIFKKK